jgi:hypothetical protein
MSWAVGYDSTWCRDIGYGVPAICDQPGCTESIDRGLGFVCGGEPYGGEHGCGLYFCFDHGGGAVECGHVFRDDDPSYQPSPDTAEWVNHKMTHESWAEWRAEQGLAAATEEPAT